MQTVEARPLSRAEFEWFRELIESKTGLYILDYKVRFLTNRLLKRMKELELNSFSDYRDLLQRDNVNGEELKILLEEIVVFESWFFRNTRQFQIFTDVVIKALMADKIMNEQRVVFNIFGCSAGQEPYSLAILLKENLPDAALSQVRINAIDISNRLLRKAKEGVYREYEINGLSPAVLDEYFDRVEKGYRIKHDISRMINFFKFNLKDSNWNKFMFSDVIFCRNTLIYFREKTRKQVMKRLINCLRPGGFILLGHSEILSRDEYDNISSIGHNVYRKVNA